MGFGKLKSIGSGVGLCHVIERSDPHSKVRIRGFPSQFQSHATWARP